MLVLRLQRSPHARREHRHRTAVAAGGQRDPPDELFIVRESGTLSIPITATSDREVDWAALYVYLLSSDSGRDYCGQNLPDTPTWGPFRKGQTVTVTISGFQVGRMPCQVTGIRAMLHTRNSGLLTPPTASETIAEATMTIAYSLQ